jgi:DNA polymerase-3 subunit epsilon
LSRSDRLVAVDLETTGLIPGVDRIVEIGAVAFRRDGAVEETWSELVDPGIPMPADAGRVNGITDEMLRSAPTIDGSLPRFLDFLGESCPVAHNASFDAGFLAADVASLGLAGSSAPFIDTRRLARIAFPCQPSYSLDSLRQSLRLPRGIAHRALADAESCRLLLLACLERIAGSGEASPECLAARCGPPIDLAGRPPAVASMTVALKRAMERGGDVEIVYESAAMERTCRRVTPRRFEVRGGAPALVAWCHLRSAERTFAVESIREIRPA